MNAGPKAKRVPAAGVALVLAGAAVWLTGAMPSRAASIVRPSLSPSIELAAKEIRRYVYLRTGALLPVVESARGEAIVLETDPRLETEQYRLKTEGGTLTISGGSDVAVLYGAYHFAEKLGVRFYLHGDVIPDERIAFALPVLDETHRPLFATRGILPFHDFPEGPDWWNQDDYLAYVSQLAKLRMNMLAMHSYPEGLFGPEPLVWMGLPQDVDKDGRVRFSYKSSWANTLRNSPWGYAPLETGEFTGGTAQLFPGDAYGPDVMKDLMPAPKTPAACNELFNRTGEQFRTVFARAKALGVRTSIGTETPLTIPATLREHLKQLGRNPDDIETVRDIYAGVFRRISAAHPVDYYWLWTPEVWSWNGNTMEQFEATKRDILSAYDALQSLGKPHNLAIAGWTLGAHLDRAAFDRFLPGDSPIVSLNRVHGHQPVDYAFAGLQGRPKWAIPWMENDANMLAYQPWVGRMRHDAVDARRVGCDGLLGIHWRTKILAMNVAALAAAAWDQSWVPPTFDNQPVMPPRLRVRGPGHQAVRAAAMSADIDVPELFPTVRYETNGFTVPIANGTYTVTLEFNGTHGAGSGQGLFQAIVQDRQVAGQRDLFAVAGEDKGHDLVVSEVKVTEGRLRIAFVPGPEPPCLSGVAVSRMTEAVPRAGAAPLRRGIHCGGGAVQCYESDSCGGMKNPADETRTMPVRDFYVDFARAHFGDAVAEDAGAIMASLDGMGFRPDPTGWVNGPGHLSASVGYRIQAREKGAMVERLAGLRARVITPGSRQRFDYWLNTMRAAVAMFELGGIRGDLDGVITTINAEADADAARKARLGAEALARRLELARKWEDLLHLQTAVADTPGELGTIANLEQHNRMASAYLTLYDQVISAALGRPLPAEAAPAKSYRGAPRLTVTTVRSAVTRDEVLSLNIIAPARQRAKSVLVRVRPLGRGRWRTVAAAPLGRAVYQAKLPAARDDFEYYVKATFAHGRILTWPVTAPELNQTVVVTKEASGIPR